MFEHITVEAPHKLRKERGLERQKGETHGGFYVHKAVELRKKRLECTGHAKREDKDVLVVAAESTKECARSLAEANRVILWGGVGLHKNNVWAF